MHHDSTRCVNHPTWHAMTPGGLVSGLFAPSCKWKSGKFMAVGRTVSKGGQMNGRCKQCQEGKWRILLLTSLVEKRPRYVSQSIALPQSRVRVSLPIYATKDRIQMQNIWNHIKSPLCKSHLRTFPNSNNKSMCAAGRQNVLLKKVLWLHLQFFVNKNEGNTVEFYFGFLKG